MSFETAPHAHLEPAEVAAYVDRTAPRETRDRIAHHLVSCAACRAEVTDVERWRHDTRRRQALLGVAGLVAAAAILLLVVRPAPLVHAPRRPPLATPERAAGPAPEAGEALRAWSSTGAAGRAFGWSGAGSHEAQYEIVVADSTGRARWTATTADTVAALPDSVRLVPGTYYWHVDALLPDGRSRTTGTKTLTVSR